MTCSSRAVFTAWFVPITIISNFLVLLIIIGITYYGVTIQMKPSHGTIRFSVCQMELENEATVQSNVHLKVAQQYKEMIVKDESF